MKSLNYLEDERLVLLPENYRLIHEFCFYLHDSVLTAFIQYEESNVHNQVIEGFEKYIVENNLEDKFEDVNILDLLKEKPNGYPLYKKHILNQTIIALIADMLNFIYEALTCLEKRKFSVALSLLRKPFKEHLLYLSWILADEDDFIRRFEKDNFESFKFKNHTKESDYKNLFKKAISKLDVQEAFDEEIIWDNIFSKQNEQGFEHAWQRATHLTTSAGKLLKTEDLSFNFIFDNPADNTIFDFLDNGLAYLLFYMLQVTLACLKKINPLNEVTINHLSLVSLGIFESLNDELNASNTVTMINNLLQELLKCVYCQGKLELTNSNFPRFAIKELIECPQCNLENDIPLYWLLAKAKFQII